MTLFYHHTSALVHLLPVTRLLALFYCPILREQEQRFLVFSPLTDAPAVFLTQLN